MTRVGPRKSLEKWSCYSTLSFLREIPNLRKENPSLTAPDKIPDKAFWTLLKRPLANKHNVKLLSGDTIKDIHLTPSSLVFKASMPCLVARSCLTLWNPMDCSPPGSSVLWDSPGKNTGMGCHALLQRILPTQGSNPGLPHYRQILYPLRHQGNPRILE